MINFTNLNFFFDLNYYKHEDFNDDYTEFMDENHEILNRWQVGLTRFHWFSNIYSEKKKFSHILTLNFKKNNIFMNLKEISSDITRFNKTPDFFEIEYSNKALSYQLEEVLENLILLLKTYYHFSGLIIQSNAPSIIELRKITETFEEAFLNEEKEEDLDFEEENLIEIQENLALKKIKYITTARKRKKTLLELEILQDKKTKKKEENEFYKEIIRKEKKILFNKIKNYNLKLKKFNLRENFEFKNNNATKFFFNAQINLLIFRNKHTAFNGCRVAKCLHIKKSRKKNQDKSKRLRSISNC